MKPDNVMAIIVGLAGAVTVLSLVILYSVLLNDNLESYYTNPNTWDSGTSAGGWYLTLIYLCMVVIGVTGFTSVMVAQRYLTNSMAALRVSLLAILTLIFTSGLLMVVYILILSLGHRLPYFVNMITSAKDNWIFDLILIVLSVIASILWSCIVNTMIKIRRCAKLIIAYDDIRGR